MRLYEYVCARGHITEEFRAMKDRNKPGVCVKCQPDHEATRLVLSVHQRPLNTGTPLHHRRGD